MSVRLEGISLRRSCWREFLDKKEGPGVECVGESAKEGSIWIAINLSEFCSGRGWLCRC